MSGGIAAYKAVDLASKLYQAGAIVDVILSRGGPFGPGPVPFDQSNSASAFTQDDGSFYVGPASAQESWRGVQYWKKLRRILRFRSSFVGCTLPSISISAAWPASSSGMNETSGTFCRCDQR